MKRLVHWTPLFVGWAFAGHTQTQNLVADPEVERGVFKVLVWVGVGLAVLAFTAAGFLAYSLIKDSRKRDRTPE
ncbi:hypothetical protein [Marinithermus hydrothermalis]|uniref:CcmD family protein n=1 Tax=Marinithermus hydrothermalis (strain DSM 14884 / JCM 11576 / T1) TaxID=869210 RepID=F2NNF0_MARHT|nr:hypothetical protein [Marinithermus hydrothermalis]AEB10991.1 hypothetical protein Marky_0230 [Marinithermus hydrothermalis DSM 14884]